MSENSMYRDAQTLSFPCSCHWNRRKHLRMYIFNNLLSYFSLPQPFSSSFSLFNKMSGVGRSSYTLPRQHGLSLRGDKRDRVVRIISNIVKICEELLALYIYISVRLGLFMEMLSNPSGLTNYFINYFLSNSLH